MRIIRGGGSGNEQPALTGNTVVVLGDSITVGTNGTAIYHGDLSWATYATLLAKGRFNLIYNAGISGNTTAQMLARIQTDVIAKKPQICVIMGGTNDVAQGVDYATTTSNIEQMIKTLQSSNIMPILATIPPADSAGNQSRNDAVNAIIRNLAIKYHLHLADFTTPLVSNGLMNATYSGDLVHPNASGAKLLGQKFVSDIVPLLPNNAVHLPLANNTSSNKVKNGLFTVDTNADGVPDNWAKNGTGAGTVSLVSDAANIQGNWLEINKTVNDTNAISLTSDAFSVTANNKVLICGKIQTNGAEAGGLKYNLNIGKNDGTYDYPAYNLTRDIDGVFYTELVIPAGINLLNITLEATSGIGKARIAQVGAYDLSTFGL